MNRQINHKMMRVIVGCIAILLAPTVYWLANSDNPMTSISIAYWTDSRDIFVGSAIAIGFFLSAYNGTGEKKDWEYYLSKMAGLFAVCIAFFPTKNTLNEAVAVKWIQNTVTYMGSTTETIHNISAICLFTCLIILMWFFSSRAISKGKPHRAYIYRAISILMGLGIISIFFLGKMVFKLDSTVFWVEVWGLTLFGTGWLIAGSYTTETIT